MFRRNTRRAMLVVAAVAVVAAVSLAFNSRTGTHVRLDPTVTVPTLYMTHNGAVIGTATPPAGIRANDIDLHWTTPRICYKNYQWPPVVLFWTVNGTNVGAPILAPCKVNDFEASWDPNYTIIGASSSGAPLTGWTVNGQIVTPLHPPAGANDFHLYWLAGGKMTAGDWTLDGKTIAKIPLPTKTTVNDAHFFLP